MAGRMPASLKPIVPFLQRASELDKHDPTVSYFCRYYAVQLALEIRQKMPTPDPDATKVLRALMQKLEEVAQEHKNHAEGQQHVERFALEVFHRADEADVAGTRTNETAKTFYAAVCFFDSLQQFGDISPDLVEKRKYAKWRLHEITKANKEGREPTAPPERDLPDESDDLGDDFQLSGQSSIPPPEEVLDDGNDLPEAPTHSPADLPPPAYTPPSVGDDEGESSSRSRAGSSSAAPVHPPPKEKKSLVAKLFGGSGGGSSSGGHNSRNTSLDAIADAQKNARYAVSSLQGEDVDSAVNYLRKALERLTS